MKISEFLSNDTFDVNANVRIFAGGSWNEDGKQVGYCSCGHMEADKVDVLDANITYVTTDDQGNIVLECDAVIEKPKQVLEITKMLTVSTGHVTEETFHALEQDGVTNKIMLPVYSKATPDGDDSFGLYIYITDDCLDWDNIPEDLKPLIKLAQEQGCGVLCLDSDGQELEGYELYE